MISLSIVSHGQGRLLKPLLADLVCHCKEVNLELILTLNLPEEVQFPEEDYDFPVKLIRNQVPLGFGANHNQAYKQANGRFFCVLNPDVRFGEDVFTLLAAVMSSDTTLGVLAPQVVNPAGQLEDSVRGFPTLLGLIGKLVGIKTQHVFRQKDGLVLPDWVAGMCMMFRKEAFCAVGGFDEDFFLYYEDVDICARMWKAGWRVGQYPALSIVHDAQRTSRHNFRYMRWHVASMARYFWKHWGSLPRGAVS